MSGEKSKPRIRDLLNKPQKYSGYDAMLIKDENYDYGNGSFITTGDDSGWKSFSVGNRIHTAVSVLLPAMKDTQVRI